MQVSVRLCVEAKSNGGGAGGGSAPGSGGVEAAVPSAVIMLCVCLCDEAAGGSGSAYKQPTLAYTHTDASAKFIILAEKG